jgi:hypothetical protein
MRLSATINCCLVYLTLSLHIRRKPLRSCHIGEKPEE